MITCAGRLFLCAGKDWALSEEDLLLGMRAKLTFHRH
jgi:hypothetical protein